MKNLKNGNGRRPIQDISFVGKDVYHCHWDGFVTKFFKNNILIKSLNGKHQGLSWPYIVHRDTINVETGNHGPSDLSRVPEPGDYLTGCKHGDVLVTISKSGYECTTNTKLHGTPSDLHLQGVEFNNGTIYTLWGNSSWLTKDWVVMSHSFSGELISKLKAPIRPKVVSWKDLFAKRYEPEGLSLKGNTLYFGYCVKRWDDKYECHATPVLELFDV